MEKNVNDRDSTVRSAFWGSILRPLPGGNLPFRQNKNRARGNFRATPLFRRSRLRFCSAGVDLSSGTNKRRRRTRAKGFFGCVAIAFPPADFPVQAVKTRRARTHRQELTLCGVAMDSYAKTTRSGRNTRAMRHVSRVATDNFPRKSTWPAEPKPMMATQVDCAPRRQCRLGYFSGGVGRPYRKKLTSAKIRNVAPIRRSCPCHLAGGLSPTQSERNPMTG